MSRLQKARDNFYFRKATKICNFIEDKYNSIIKKRTPTFDEMFKMLTKIVFDEYKIKFIPFRDNDITLKFDMMPNEIIIVYVNEYNFDLQHFLKTLLVKGLTKELQIKDQIFKKNNKEFLLDLPYKPMREYFRNDIDNLSVIASREERLIGISKYELFYNLLFGEKNQIVKEFNLKKNLNNKEDYMINKWLEIQEI